MDKKVAAAAKKGSLKDLKKLQQAGISFLGSDKQGNTALHYAAESGKLDAVCLIIQAGVSPLVPNLKGQTAEDVAEAKKKKPVAQFLREHGAALSTASWTSVIKGTVNMFKYEDGAWQSKAADITLEVQNLSAPFSYKLVSPLVECQLEKNFQYSKATETFHNFRSSTGEIWGFEFTSSTADAETFFAALEDAKAKLDNPPPPPVADVAAAPAAAAAAPAGKKSKKDKGSKIKAPAAPAPPSNAPAPPPPPPAPAAPAAPPAPPAPGGGPPAPPAGGPPAAAAAPKPAGMSLADQLASKRSSLANVDEAHPPNEGAPPPAAGGGGNMMSELAMRLKKRQSMVGGDAIKKPAADDEDSGSAAPGPSSLKPAGTSRAPPASGRTNSFSRPQAEPSSSAAPFAPTGGVKKFGGGGGGKKSGGPTKEELESFKKVIVDAFKAEIYAVKSDVVANLRYELAQL